MPNSKGILSAALFCLLFTFCAAVSVKADTLNASDEIVATFTAAPNTSDMLLFYNNDHLTVTGTPVLTLTLFNGSTTLGSIVASPFVFAGTDYFENVFLSPTSGFINSLGVPAATVPFTSINGGSIVGSLIWTVSGGSVSGFSTSDFHLYDANSSGEDYQPQGDITSTITLQSKPVGTPEPSSLLMLGVGLLGLAGLTLKKSM